MSVGRIEGVWDVCLQQEWIPDPELVCMKGLILSRNYALAGAGDGKLGTLYRHYF